MTNINEKNGIKWFKFEHNQDYKELQQLFWFYQNQLDYEGIMVYFFYLLKIVKFHFLE